MKNIRSPGKLMLITLMISLALLGGILDKVERDLYGVKAGVEIEDIAVGGYLPRELQPIIEEIAAREQRGPREPSINKNGDIVPGKYGVEIEVEGSIQLILAAAKNDKVTVIRTRLYPRHSEKELQGLTRALGYFSTPAGGSYDRVQNMRIACKAINYSLLWPGDVFSFNHTVGPRTMSAGYHHAPIMLGEELIPGVGGGVCQVATTLYNAARRAKLPVIERHHHSQPVYYVGNGLDAAVAYDYMDLKFRNHFDYPVIIKSQLQNGKVQASILGR